MNIDLNVYWTWYSCNYSQERLLWHQWYGKNITLQNCVTIMHGSKSVSRTAINSWLFITLFCNRKNSEGKWTLSVFFRSLSWYLHIQISCLPSFLIYLKMKFYIYWCRHYYLDKQIKLFVMDWHSVFFIWQSQTDKQIKLFIMDWHSVFFLSDRTKLINKLNCLSWTDQTDKQIKLFIMDWRSVFFLSDRAKQINKLNCLSWTDVGGVFFFFWQNRTAWWNQPWITWKRLSQCSYRDLHYIAYHLHLCSFLQVSCKKIT